MKFYLKPTFVIVFTLITIFAHTQVVLEEDINQQPASSDPMFFVQVDDQIYFEAGTPQSGRELFSFDMISGDYQQELELEPGQEDGDAEYIAAHNGLLYFSGRMGSRRRLLVFDPQTKEVEEIKTVDNVRTENPVLMTAYDNKIFFQIDDDDIGQELGIYDTQTDELVFHDLHPDFSGFPLEFTSTDQYLYFTARSPSSESELWRYDPSIEEFAPIEYNLIGDEHPFNLRSFSFTGEKLFCYGDIDGLTDEMWIYDPADNTMRMGPEAFVGPPWSRPFGFTTLMGKVYFAARGSNGIDREVYAIDLEDYSLELIAEINPNGQSNPYGFFVKNNKLIYTAAPEDSQRYIYEFDPVTNTNTQLNTFQTNGDFNSLQFYNLSEDLTILTGESPMFGDEPHQFDVENNEINLLADINATTIGSDIFNLTEVNDKLYMSALEYLNGRQVWQYDPSSGNANLLIDADQQIKPDGFVGVDEVVYFSGIHPDNGYGIHFWNEATSTFGSTNYLTPSNIGGLEYLTALNDKVYFVPSSHPIVSSELYVYDPASDEYEVVIDLNNDPEERSNVRIHGIMNGDLIFSGTVASGRELWRMDGETEEVVALPEFHPASDTGATISSVLIQNDQIYIGASLERYELYSYQDGDNAFEQLTNFESPDLEYLTGFQDQVYFVAREVSQVGRELYRYNPASNEVQLAAEIIPGSTSASIRDLTAFNDQLFFSAETEEFGRELWSFNGSEANIFADIFPGSNGSDCKNLILFNDKLYFSADDGTYGAELWSVAECINAFADTEAQMGNELGAVDLTVQGGQLPYTFEWSNGTSTEDLDDLEAGDYSCTITDASGCISVIDITIDLLDANSEVEILNISISPNPADDFLNINIENKNGSQFSLQVVSPEGKIMYSDHFNSNHGNRPMIPTGDWASGWYVLKMQSNQNVYTSKIVVQHP